MNDERILSLDMSTKTGYASMVSKEDGIVLEAYGTLAQIHTPDGAYPESFIDWAYAVYAGIYELIERFAPDVLVIEETSAGSKAIYTQKILEWIHFLVAKFIKETKIKAVYFLTEQWRRETGCKMTKEEGKHNKKVAAYKEKNKKLVAGGLYHKPQVAYDENGKRIGRKTKKHINVRRANEVFGEYLAVPLRKKDEDTADSLLLGYSYHLRRMKLLEAK